MKAGCATASVIFEPASASSKSLPLLITVFPKSAINTSTRVGSRVSSTIAISTPIVAPPIKAMIPRRQVRPVCLYSFTAASFSDGLICDHFFASRSRDRWVPMNHDTDHNGGSDASTIKMGGKKRLDSRVKKKSPNRSSSMKAPTIGKTEGRYNGLDGLFWMEALP